MMIKSYKELINRITEIETKSDYDNVRTLIERYYQHHEINWHDQEKLLSLVNKIGDLMHFND